MAIVAVFLVLFGVALGAQSEPEQYEIKSVTITPMEEKKK